MSGCKEELVQQEQEKTLFSLFEDEIEEVVIGKKAQEKTSQISREENDEHEKQQSQNETNSEESFASEPEVSEDTESQTSEISVQEEQEEEYSSKKKSKKKMKKERTTTTFNEKVLEARKDFEAALSRISNPSTRKNTPSIGDSVEFDDYALALKDRMEMALKRDLHSLSHQKPALERMRLLPQVLDALNKKNLQEILLENGILTPIKHWLEPLRTSSSCTLPAASFRRQLLEALAALSPVLQTAHLRESGVGKIVYFFSKREGELPEIKKLATELVNTWSRPLIAANMNRDEDGKNEYHNNHDYDNNEDADYDNNNNDDENGNSKKMLQSDSFKAGVFSSPVAAASTVRQRLISKGRKIRQS